MTLKISKNQMSLRYNGDKFIAVKSQSSDCNNCAFFCCELEDEKQETYCNPSNRTDGQFIIWMQYVKSENINPIYVEQIIDSFKKLNGSTAKDVISDTGIDFRIVSRAIAYLLKKSKLIKIGKKYYWIGIR